MASEFDPYRKLGQAVLGNAVHDASTKQVDRKERELARQFLRGGQKLTFWCAVAGVNPLAVQEAAKRRWRST